MENISKSMKERSTEDYSTVVKAAHKTQNANKTNAELLEHAVDNSHIFKSFKYFTIKFYSIE